MKKELELGFFPALAVALNLAPSIPLISMAKPITRGKLPAAHLIPGCWRPEATDWH
jgi:hypothetical protein